jgi:hypothetical protein
MVVAKLSTDRIVQLLRVATPDFAEHQMALVADKLTTNVRKIDPYWVPATQVVWVKEI